MKNSLEMIIKWLKDSGLKVNELKSELCLFSKRDYALVTLNINGFEIKSKITIKFLRVFFYSKLMWQPQIENVIKRASKAKHAISLIKKYFKRNELNNLLTLYFTQFCSKMLISG